MLRTVKPVIYKCMMLSETSIGPLKRPLRREPSAKRMAPVAMPTSQDESGKSTSEVHSHQTFPRRLSKLDGLQRGQEFVGEMLMHG